MGILRQRDSMKILEESYDITMILQVFDSIMGIIEKCQGIIWILHYDEDI
jgi:hypothetical protein